MAWVTINEYETVAFTLLHGQVVVCPQEPAIKKDHVAITGASVPYGPFDAKTRFVRLNCDEACCIDFANPGDPDPVAQDTYYRMGPNESLFTGVTPKGQLAVIASST
jgi:hypothetical protein